MDGTPNASRRNEKSDQPLVGRSAEFEALRSRLDGSSTWAGLDLRGRYGTGRSAISVWFADEAADRNWATLRAQRSPRNVAIALGELVGQVPTRRSFSVWRRRRAFRKRLRRWLEMYDGLAESSGDLTQTATDIVGSGASLIASPVAGAAVGIVSTGAREIAAQSKGAADVRLHVDAERELTALFLDVVQAAAKRHPGIVVVFEDIDEQDAISTEWLRSLVDGTYGDLPTNAVVVATSVRGLPVERWRDGSGDGDWHVMSLEPFDLERSAEFLRSRGIADEETIVELHERADGVVGRLNRFASVELGARAEDVIGWSLLEGHEALARFASVPRRFDRDVLALVADPPPDDEAWRWLKGCGDMTLQRNGNWLVSNDYRQVLLARLRNESPDTFRDAHSALADWYSTTGKARDGALEESAYHAVTADHMIGLGRALVSGSARFDVDQLHQITEAVADAAAETEVDELNSAVGVLERAVSDASLEEWSGVAEALQELRQRGFEDARLAGRIAGWRAHALEEAGFPVSALAELDQAVAAEPDVPHHRIARVSMHFDQGHYQEALPDLDALIEDDPADRGRRVMRTVCRLLAQAPADAIEDVTVIIEQTPGDVEALSIRAQAHQAAGNAEEALADAARLIELEPEAEAHRLLQAQLRVANGDREAIEEYAKLADSQASALARNINEMRARMSPDTFKQFISGWAAAQGMPTSMLDRLVAGDPDPDLFEAMMRAEAAAQRGQLLTATDRPAEALDAFDASLDLDSDNLGVHVLRAATFLKAQSADALLADVDGPEAPSSESARLLQRAIALRAMDKKAEARAALDAATELQPTAPELPRVSCNLRLADQDVTGAIQDLKRVLELDETRWQDWCGLAQLYIRTEDVEGFAGVAELLSKNSSVVIPFMMRQSLAAEDPSVAGFGELLRRDPAGALRSFEATGPVLRARLRWEDGQRQDALVDLREAAEQWPEQPEPWQTLAILLAEAPEAGLPHRNEPTGSVDRVWEALVLDRREEHDAALELLESGFDGPPSVPYGYLLRAQLRVRAGDNDAALRDLADGLAATNGANFLRHERARLYTLLHRPEDALADYDALIERGGGLTADVRYQRGELLRTLGRFSEALVDLAVANQLDPDNALIIGTAGQTFLAMNDLAQAIQIFDMALALDDSLNWALHERANALVSAGRLERAEADVQLLEVRSPGPLTRFTQAHLAMASDRPGDAVEIFEELVEELPSGAFFMAELVGAMRLAGRADEAIETGQAIPEDERSNELRYEVARAALDAGRAEEAEPVFRQLADAEGATPFMHYETGRALRHLGRLDEADEWTRRALDAEVASLEDEAVAFVRSLKLCNAGLCHAALGDAAAAGTSYRQAIETSQEPAIGRQARIELEELRAAGGDGTTISQLLSELFAGSEH